MINYGVNFYIKFFSMIEVSIFAILYLFIFVEEHDIQLNVFIISVHYNEFKKYIGRCNHHPHQNIDCFHKLRGTLMILPFSLHHKWAFADLYHHIWILPSFDININIMKYILLHVEILKYYFEICLFYQMYQNSLLLFMKIYHNLLNLYWFEFCWTFFHLLRWAYAFFLYFINMIN